MPTGKILCSVREFLFRDKQRKCHIVTATNLILACQIIEIAVGSGNWNFYVKPPRGFDYEGATKH